MLGLKNVLVLFPICMNRISTKIGSNRICFESVGGRRLLSGRRGASVQEDPQVSSDIEVSSSHNNEWSDLLLHIGSCLLLSVCLCTYEDFDCRELKPNVHLRPQAIRGMGEGYKERQQDWRRGNVLVMKDDVSLTDIKNYNEVMEYHRRNRVPGWSKEATPTDTDVRGSVRNVFAALESLEELKIQADDYNWDKMRIAIRSQVFTSDLEQSCNTLRRSLKSIDARNEIGFDWGSCAWRHCGAEADAQEALAELYNLLGVLEPFECRFIIDVVERSLRDVLAVVPTKYYEKPLPEYVPYKISEVEDDQKEASLDEELLNTLNKFRNNDNNDAEEESS